MAGENVFRPDIPSTARMYDYYLGGKDNYPADREAAEKVMSMFPPGAIRSAVWENRKFLGRVVRYLAGEAGVRQFLDIGTGLPTMNQVHEVAQEMRTDCRVVYVDHDPVVLAHGRDVLNGVANATIIQHDLREPEAILRDPELRALLDLDEPVALLLVAILHFVTDEDDPWDGVRALKDALPSGSYLALSHGTSDGDDRLDEAARVGYANASSSARLRPRGEVAAFFDGFEMVDPGLVWLPEWRPDHDTKMRDNASESVFWCGVARKP
jgi:S-adenosyl methyltransferase